MDLQRSVPVVDSHTEGMPTRVITGGIGAIPGQTMAEKCAWLKSERDGLRGLLMCEPRGHAAMYGALLLPPADPSADLGVIFLDAAGYLPMSGHCSIGAVTVALTMGLLPPVSPVTRVRLDTPVGLVEADAHIESGQVTSVTLHCPPAFLYRPAIPLEVTGLGRIQTDIAFGGNFTALVEAKHLGLWLDLEEAERLIAAGMQIMRAVQEQVLLAHPLHPEESASIKQVMFTGAAHASTAHARGATVLAPGILDRSACGTGTCARMAQLFAHGSLAIGEVFVHEGILGTSFQGCLREQLSLVPGWEAVRPTITGRAWIIAFAHLVLDTTDPFPAGFLLSHEGAPRSRL